MIGSPQKMSEGRIAFLEGIIRDLPVGVIVLDNDCRVVIVNRMQEKVSKVKCQDVIGTTFHETWKDILDLCTTDKKAYRNYYFDLIKKRKPYMAVYHNLIPQFYNEKISGVAYGAPLRSGEGFILVHEISNEIKKDKIFLEKLNLQLSKANTFLENLLDSSPNAVISTDEKGIIQTVNKTAEDLFGISNKKFLYRPIFDLLSDYHTVDKFKEIQKTRNGIETKCRKSNGKLFPAKMQLSEFKSSLNEASLSRLFIFQDMTLEKSLELSIADRLKFEETISELSATFINLPTKMIDQKIEEGIKITGNFLEIDEAILAQFLNDGKDLKITHVNDSMASTFILKQAVESYPWYMKKITKGETIILPRVFDDSPEEAQSERKLFSRYGHKSNLGIPLIVGNDVLGFLSFSSLYYYRSWPEALIKRFRLVAEIFANILMRKKSEEYLEKAFTEIQSLKNKIELERNYLRDEIRLAHNFENIIGQSEALQYVFFKVEQVAPTDSTVLVLGETGTGKELIARGIHNASNRTDRPFIKVDCATLAENVIENELFGHEKGAFTGAHAKHLGRFEFADGATIFLDEIGELPLKLQSKLLRIIQEGEFERIGGSRTIKVDVRIIAATNRNLEKEVEQGRFRKDLYYRLNVFPITVPPLRKRKEDLPLLIDAFVKKFSKKLGKAIKDIPSSTINALMRHSWPGNVRELENVIERAVINSSGSRLELTEKFETLGGEPFQKNIDNEPLIEVERNHIMKLLNEKKWVIEGKRGAASALGLAPSTLRYRLTKLNIKRP